MTSELEKKLDEIFAEHIDDRGNTNYLALVEDIYQAFKDAGYRNHIVLSREDAYKQTNDPIYLTPMLMTGQEWYDRFKEAVDGHFNMQEKTTDNYHSILSAAKKAANIK